MADDTRWIEKAKRGSRAAAEELIRRYYDEIYRYAFRQTGQKETAMDITQEIFIAVLQSLPYYDEKKAGVRTWIYRIATHKIIDSRRRAPIPALDIGEMVLADEMDVAGAIEQTWTTAKTQIQTVVNNVVFPVVDMVLAILFFVKVGTAYFDYRKHGQFEFAAPCILFACLIFTLTAPLYIWTIL